MSPDVLGGMRGPSDSDFSDWLMTRRARSQEAGGGGEIYGGGERGGSGGGGARVEVVAGAKGIARAVIYLPIM